MFLRARAAIRRGKSRKAEMEGGDGRCFNSFLLSKLFSVNFQGPKGAKGDQGSAGITGQKGETGEMGLSGPPVRPSFPPCTSAAWCFTVPISADAQNAAGFAALSEDPSTPCYCRAGRCGSFEFYLLKLMITA